MSIIVKFPLERVQRRSVGIPDGTHNADILVFEGVRYDKRSQAKTALKKKKNPRKQVT